MSFSSVLDLLRAFALHLHWIIDHIQGLQRDVFEGRNTITAFRKQSFESKADCSTGNSREDIVVTRLRHKYVNTAIESYRDATANDPLALYKFDTPDNMGGWPEKLRKSWFKLKVKLETHYCISSERKIALTVHDGFAFAIATNASNSKRGKKELFSYVFERVLGKISGYLLSAEQKKRFKELQESVEKLSSTLGEDLKDMIYLDMLMTGPAFQGQGYGSALVDVINDIGDSQSRRVYLLSSNIANTGFYNSHGFETITTAALGESNPTWTKKPVIISLAPDKNVYYKVDSQEPTDEIVVTKLRHVDVRLAQKSLTDANVGSPLQLYVLDTPDKEKRRRGSKAFFNITGRMNFHYFISSKRTIAFAVHHGIATVLAAYAPNSKEGKKGLFDRIVGHLSKPHEKALLYFLSPEQRKRYKEVVTKLEKLVSTLGDDSKDMIPLISLGTAPAYQNRGYGGALVEAINAIADSQGRKVQLISGNIDNTEFYNSHGYFTTATVALGEDNPTWDKEPVIVSLMVRGGDDEEKFSERKS